VFPLLRLLREARAEVTARPRRGPEALQGLVGAIYMENLANAVKEADAVVIATNWDRKADIDCGRRGRRRMTV
jgi:hypothetical protein